MEDKTLIAHETYNMAEIENISGLLERAKTFNGLRRITLNDRIRLVNFLILKYTKTNREYSSIEWGPLFEELRNYETFDALRRLICIIADGTKIKGLRQKIGYKYCCAPPTPSSVPDFPIDQDHSYIDVGCGFGESSIDLYKEVGQRTTLVDPNAYNVRMVFHNLEKNGLLEDNRIKVKIGTIQGANLPPDEFDRAFLSNTLAFEPDDVVMKIIESTVRLIRKNGIIAILGMSVHGVRFPVDEISRRTNKSLLSRIVKNTGGSPINLVRVQV